jgi:hypothetical protein
MKYIIFLITLAISLYASMGNCLECHPKLAKDIQNDKNHLPMKGCIKCHTPSKKKLPECGDRCFKCHSHEDMEDEDIPQHRVFENCRDCHAVDSEHIFNPADSFNQSRNSSLQEFLF